MAVRRTREEKIRIQQRREEEKIVWIQPEKSVKSGASVQHPTKVRTPAGASSKNPSPETVWLRKDLKQTVIALLVVLVLLSLFVWRSL